MSLTAGVVGTPLTHTVTHCWCIEIPLSYIRTSLPLYTHLSTYYQLATQQLQWNLSIKDTLNEGHLSNEDTVCSLNDIELCTNLIRYTSIYRTTSSVPVVYSIER